MNIGTYTGIIIPDIYKITEDDIHPLDIAQALSMNCRYNGMVALRNSVAEHSVMMYDRGREEGWDDQTCKEILLHDAHEAYTGDLIAPLKQLPQFACFVELEDIVDGVIRRKFDLRPEFPPIVKELDLSIREAEVRDLRNNLSWDRRKASRFGKVRAWTPETARWNFINRMRQCGIEVKYV